MLCSYFSCVGSSFACSSVATNQPNQSYAAARIKPLTRYNSSTQFTHFAMLSSLPLSMVIATITTIQKWRLLMIALAGTFLNPNAPEMTHRSEVAGCVDPHRIMEFSISRQDQNLHPTTLRKHSIISKEGITKGRVCVAKIVIAFICVIRTNSSNLEMVVAADPPLGSIIASIVREVTVTMIVIGVHHHHHRNSSSMELDRTTMTTIVACVTRVGRPIQGRRIISTAAITFQTLFVANRINP